MHRPVNDLPDGGAIMLRRRQPVSPFRYFTTSLEMIPGPAVQAGKDISCETVRFWWNRFGPLFASEILECFITKPATRVRYCQTNLWVTKFRCGRETGGAENGRFEPFRSPRPASERRFAIAVHFTLTVRTPIFRGWA
jgi:hypothetical protein